MADFNNGLAVNGPLTISDEVTASVHFGAVVKAIIDDCSRHTDGGAWRKQCQGKSWFTEALGGEVWIGQQASIAAAWAAANSLPGAVFQATATAGPLTSGKFYVATSATTATEVFRGISRDYPDAVLWVAEAGRVVGYDMTKPGYPMWMVFVASNGGTLFNGSCTSIAAFNGQLVVGSVLHLAQADFSSDYTRFRNANGNLYNVNRIVNRNSATGPIQSGTIPAIVNQAVNDVAITALDTAPIDPSTGLPVPTIAVATSGGVSVIKDDGTVASLTLTTNSATSVSIIGDRFLYSISNTSRYLAEYSLRTMTSHTISTLDSTDSQRLAIYGTTATGFPALTAGGPTGALVTCANSVVAVGGTSALNVLRRNPTTQAAGMVSYITNTYNSGWQVGDSRGAYLADTTAETVTASGELVTNGTFTTDTSGWTQAFSSTLAFNAGKMQVTAPVGSNGTAYQVVTTVVGRSYYFTVDISAVTTAANFVIGNSSGNNSVYDGYFNATTRTLSGYFVATSTTTYISCLCSPTTGIASFDNISVKLADPDRSVKNNGLVLNGTLTKTAVASGAGLVAYSGFSASNYLTQPYSANLDFGTGDFCVMGWFNVAATTANLRVGKGTVAATSWYVSVDNLGDVYFINSNSTAYVKFTGAAPSGSMTLVCVKRTSTAITASFNGRDYVVGSAVVGTIFSNTLTETAPLTIDSVSANSGSLALVRISATAPTADQIAHIYRTELPLFQPNAQCTLAGTTSSVTAMSYDDATNELHVTTAGNRSGFIDLLRVESDTLAVGTSTTVAAYRNAVITGGSTSARVYAPALNIRDAVMQGNENRYGPNNYITSLGNISSVNGGALAGLRNRIINGGMSVSQRNGATATAVGTTASSSYNVDRWQTYRTGAVTGATSTGLQLTGLIGGPPHFTKVQRDSGNTSTAAIILATSLESTSVYDLQGKTVTLSFWLTTVGAAQTNGVQAQISTGTGTDGNHFAGFTSNSSVVAQSFAPSNWTRCSITGVVPQSAMQLGVNFSWTPTGTAGASDYFGITGVQLELGSVATPFEHRPYGMELALCQRYYRPVSFVSGVWASSTTAVLSVMHPGMRASPSAGINGAATVVNGPTSFTQSSANVSVFSNLPDNGAYQLTNFTGATSATPALLTSGAILLTSEI